MSGAFIAKTATLPAENARERNSRAGIIGRAARRSQAAKAAAAAAPAARVPVTSALSQPAVFPRTSPHTRPSAATVTSGSPGTSMTPPGPLDSFIRRRTRGMAATVTGTFSQKIHCQPSPWVIAPPRSGPATAASAVTPP